MIGKNNPEQSDWHIPINRCFKSYPVLSLRNVPSMSSTSPFARTASRPERLAKNMLVITGITKIIDIQKCDDTDTN